MSILAGSADFLRGAVSRVFERPEGRKVPLVLAGVYLLLGTAWVVILEVAEGMSFVDLMEDSVITVSSAGIVYWLSRSAIAAVRRKAGDLLRSEERLKAFAEAADNGIVATDRENRVVYANRAAATILGRKRGEIIGEFADGPGWEWSTPAGEPLPAEGLPFRQVHTSGRPVYGVPLAATRPDGTRVLASANAVPIRDADGRIAEIVVSLSDVTERRKTEDFGLHANRTGSFRPVASWIAREVKNSNDVILSYLPELQLCCDDTLSVLSELTRGQGEMYLGGHPLSELRDLLPWAMKQIAENSERIRFVADKLDEFAKWEVPLPKSKIDVNEVTRSAVGILGNEIARSTDRFRADYETRLPPVRGSALEIEQALVHLITNALQALPDRDRAVRVSTSMHRELNCVEVRVRDEGIGMSERTLSHLAEPFSTTRQVSGGGGLGLFVARSIVKRHMGTIVFRSAAGRGTTACVFLPAGTDGGTQS